jgi:hypothetical protein
MSVAELAPPAVEATSVNIRQISVTVTVNRLFETAMPGVTNYFLTVDPQLLPVGDPKAPFTPELVKVIWTLKRGDNVPDASFAYPGVIFADPMAPFLLNPWIEPVPDPVTGDPDPRYEGYWSNLEHRNRRAFPYTIYVKVGDANVLHDPTVENQPPFAG